MLGHHQRAEGEGKPPLAFQTFNKSFCSSHPYNPSRDELDPRPLPENGAGGGIAAFPSLRLQGDGRAWDGSVWEVGVDPAGRDVLRDAARADSTLLVNQGSVLREAARNS